MVIKPRHVENSKMAIGEYCTDIEEHRLEPVVFFVHIHTAVVVVVVVVVCCCDSLWMGRVGCWWMGFLIVL